MEERWSSCELFSGHQLKHKGLRVLCAIVIECIEYFLRIDGLFWRTKLNSDLAKYYEWFDRFLWLILLWRVGLLYHCLRGKKLNFSGETMHVVLGEKRLWVQLPYFDPWACYIDYMVHRMLSRRLFNNWNMKLHGQILINTGIIPYGTSHLINQFSSMFFWLSDV